MWGKNKILIAAVISGLFSVNSYGEPVKLQPAEEVTTMVVTAQKKEENIQQVPISIDAFSQMDLEDAKINTTKDLVKFSSNVHIKKSHVENALVIRGISAFHSSVYSPAGYYVDDISYPLQYMQNTGLLDIERAEVLKGPQGTLYGHNSESGVINIITRQPGNEFMGKITGEFSSYDTYKAETSISTPLVKDRLFIRGAFQYMSSDGFYEDEITGDDKVQDMERINGRTTLRWKPSDNLDISLIGSALDDNGHGGGFRYIKGPKTTGRYKVRKDCDEYLDQEGSSSALRIKYKGKGFDVLWATSILDQSLDKQNDADGWAYSTFKKSNIFLIDEQLLSQEIRVSSSNDGPFEWLTGLYGFSEETRFDFQYDYASPLKTKTFMHPVTDIDTQGYAVFGQGTYTLFDKLHLTAGLRYDHQTLQGDLSDKIRNLSFSKERNFHEVLPKFSAGYTHSQNLMIYSSISKGYLTGGFNWLTKAKTGFNYDPEYTWNYETGIKTTWMNNKLLVNLALFYIEIEDKQVSQVDSLTLSSYISNAAEAHSSGLELQVKATPVKGLDLFVGFGFNESKFDDFTALQWNATNTEVVEKNFSDNTLPYAPRYTFNAGVQYRSMNQLFFRADFFGTDKFYGDAGNKAKQNYYQTVNLAIGYEGSCFDINVWAKNIFDEKYCSWIMARNDGVMGMDGEPQIFGITATYRF